jgi:hypothetical protein
MIRRLTRWSVAAAALALSVGAAPAAAESLWVAQVPTVSGNGTSCTTPGYNAIQAAVVKAGAGATLHVCRGVYVEQLQITKSLSIVPAGAVSVKLPVSPADSTTTCDVARGEPHPQDIVSICGHVTVSIKGVTIEGPWPTGTCNDFINGILVAGEANLRLTNSTVLDAGGTPINGCQGGDGIRIGVNHKEPANAGTATLVNDTVSGYQKGGIVDYGEGSRATMTSVTVTGAGETPEIAQNGIEVLYGARGNITKANVSGNECNDVAGGCGPNMVSETESCGVLFYGALAGSTVTSSTVESNDIGVFYEDESAAAPTAPQVTIVGDTIAGSRDAAVLLGQGNARVNTSTLNGGQTGIGLLQLASDSYGPTGSGSGDIVENMSKWAVWGLSDKGTDPAGSFTITKSSISGNPTGAGVTESVHTESPNLNIFTTPSDS